MAEVDKRIYFFLQSRVVDATFSLQDPHRRLHHKAER
jgi:hypothetical protein